MTPFGLCRGAPQRQKVLVKGKTGLARKSVKSSQSFLFYKTLFQQLTSAGEGRQSAEQEGQLVPSVCVGGKPHQAAWLALEGTFVHNVSLSKSQFCLCDGEKTLLTGTL